MGQIVSLWTFVIIADAVLSWVRPDPYNPIVQTLHRLSEPACKPFRRWLPSWRLGVDLSPLLAILSLRLIDMWILESMSHYGRIMASSVSF